MLPGQEGNVAIAGHRDTFFRPLRNIQKDDEITLTTLNGSYRYRVASIRVVEPENIEVLDNSDDAILGDLLPILSCRLRTSEILSSAPTEARDNVRHRLREHLG